MKINLSMTFMFFTFILMDCTGCGPTPGDGGTRYSPLYKYRAYPVTNVQNNTAIGIHAIQILSLYDGYQTMLSARNGIISNATYPEIGQGFVVMYSNGTSLTNFILTNVPYNRIVTANNKYIALLVSNTLMVLDTGLSNRFSLPINTNLFIAALGNGDSPLLAYGEVTELFTNSFTTVYSNYPAGHYLKICNLDDQTVVQLPDTYGIVGFSKGNSYLFYTFYIGPAFNFVEGQEIYPLGPLMCYELTNKRVIPIGDYNHDISNGRTSGWSDAINGIRADLKGFYVTELASGAVINSQTLEDGRSVWGEAGLWYVDISSLGLSE